MKTGVILARFQPIHNGHLQLIKKACDENEQVLVIIGSIDKLSKRNPIPWTIRKQLVEKAIKYNHTDGKVTVSAERKRKEVVLTIADTGNGIDETFRERIFEPFFRVDKSRSRKIGGVGLGLAMVREIVQVHDGEIEVHGNEQGGTTFEVKMSIERLTIKSQV